MPVVTIAMGSNLNGYWGTPERTIGQAIKQLRVAGLEQINCSPFYLTSPLGNGLQPHYHNIVFTAVTDLLPVPLLRKIKTLEALAGRKRRSHWSARVLDIDMIDYNGWIVRWPPPELRRSGSDRGRRAQGQLILPHPQAHLRSFVLQPLGVISPHWFHSALQAPLSQLIARLPPGGQVRRLDLPVTSAGGT